MEPTELSMLELGNKLGSGELSSVEAVRACLARVDRFDGQVKAFLKVDREGALAQAEAADRRRKEGRRAGPLDGVPVGLKDLFLTEGLPSTAGSRILEKFVAPYDGTVVKLLRGAGTPILGKLNMDEFAMGSSTENSAFFPTRNPWNLETSPGGSSGGSAAAVAARMVFGALGTDTGGSIRQPAALTGTVGLKPTYGRVSRFGVVAFASSLDQVGPITRDVPDCAALLQIIAVHDPCDSTSAPVKAPEYLAEIEGGVKGMKLGLPREYFELPGMDPEVRSAVEAAAEASSNLARYDGVRYGLRAGGAANLLAMYGRTRDQGFGLEVKRRIMLGTYALSAGYYDAYYLKAQKVRTLIKQDFVDAFRTVDAVLAPTSPTPAFRIGEKVSDPLAMYLNDVFTLPCNLAGLPGLSLPCGFTKANLPIGLQVLGRPWDEARVLRIGRAFEREHDFHRRAPPLRAA